MNFAFDVTASKKPTNVSINADLLMQAKTLKINLSAILEQALLNAVRMKQQELWLQENQVAVQCYNQMVEQNGCFADEMRSF